MSLAARGFALCLLLVSPSEAAFETFRAISAVGAFDPIRPGLNFWHTLPGRLVHAQSRVYLATARPYGLSDLGTSAVDVTLRPGRLGFGLSYTTLGNRDYYSETQFSAATALRVESWLSLGILTHVRQVYFGGRFAPLYDVVAGGGLCLAAARNLSIDLASTGPGGTAGGRPLSVSRLAAGVSWQYSNRLGLRAALDSEVGGSLGETLRLGPRLVLSGDLLTRPLRLQVGALLSTGRFGFDFLYRDDPELGGDLVLAVLIQL
jgi:hypothetical protein